MTKVSGDRHTSRAEAAARGVAFDQASESDFGDSPVPPERAEATCSIPENADSDETQPEQPGSAVECADNGLAAGGNAWSSEAMNLAPVRVGFADSQTTVQRSPEGGIVTSAASAAKGIEMTFPGAGSFSIGEIRAVARSEAAGRPDTARSTYTLSINQVRVADADDATLFACGWDTDSTVNSDEETRESPQTSADDPEGRCDPKAVQDAIEVMTRQYPQLVHVNLPQRDLDPEVVGSDGGARAMNRKDPFRRENDRLANSDQREEIAGLEIVVYNEVNAGVSPSEKREIFQCCPHGGTRSATSSRASPTCPTRSRRCPLRTRRCGSSSSTCRDSRSPAGCSTSRPVPPPNGARPPTTVSATVSSRPGDYVVRQAQAPDGFEAAPDQIPVSLTPGFHADIEVVNAPLTVAGAQTAQVELPTGGAGRIVKIGPRSQPSPPFPAQVRQALSDLFQFISRNPGEALLFALFWLLVVAPLYLLMRRRDLLHARIAR